MELTLVHFKNANGDYDFFLNEDHLYNISKQYILLILKKMRKIISKYYVIYKLDQIAQEKGNDSLSIDRSFVCTFRTNKYKYGFW